MSKFDKLMTATTERLHAFYGDAATITLNDASVISCMVNFDQAEQFDQNGFAQMVTYCDIKRSDLPNFQKGLIIECDGKKFKGEDLDSKFGSDAYTQRIILREIK